VYIYIYINVYINAGTSFQNCITALTREGSMEKVHEALQAMQGMQVLMNVCPYVSLETKWEAWQAMQGMQVPSIS
jgi:hypothetical protein